MNYTRRLVYDFMRLPHVTKLDIARDLDLLSEGYNELPDQELFKEIFSKAKATDNLTKLREAINNVVTVA